MNTLRELCLAPGSASQFPAERLARLEQAVVEDHKSNMPWYLRGIVGFGAWISSGFFLGFIFALTGWEDKNQATIGRIGAVLLVVAVAIGRQKWGVFAEQCALAVSLASQVMIYIGFVNEHDHPLRMAMFYSIGLAALLYYAFPSFLSRLMTCFAALQVTLMWIHVGDGDPLSGASRISEYLPLWMLAFWTLHLAGICWTLLRPRMAILFAPLGYALVASLAVGQAESSWHLWESPVYVGYQAALMVVVVFHLRVALFALTLFGVAVWAAGGVSVLREKARLFFGLALVLAALVYLGLGGVLLALLYLLLGFSLQDRAILGLGLVLFPVFLANYYYNLELDLLAKSGVLVVSGIVMLLLRMGVARGVFANKEAT